MISTRMRLMQFAIVALLLGALMPVLGGARALSALIPERGSSDRLALAQADSSDYPQSIMVQDEQFLFDRSVPVDRQELVRLERQDELTLYARSDAPPFEAVYALLAGRSSREGLGRYLPTHRDAPETPCPAEAIQIGPLQSADQSYAFAGIETDIPNETLDEVADAGGQPVYADPDSRQPAPELFVAGDEGLLRFILTDVNGVPGPLATSMVFGEQSYVFSADVTENTDTPAFVKIGCLGPFPALAAPDAAPSASTIVLQIGGRSLAFDATGPAPDNVTSQRDSTDSTPEIEDSGDTTAPPITDSAEDDELPQGTPADEDQDDAQSLPIAVSDNLGNGGQPDGLPRELTVGADRFLFDRLVPVSVEEVQLVAQQDAISVYARSPQEPFDALYLALPADDAASLARYLPERTLDPSTSCPAEAVAIGTLDAGDATYVFAGIETDLSADELEQIGDSSGQTVYAEPDTGQPAPELFISDPNGLLRFVLVNDETLPSTLTESLAFAGAQFVAPEDVTDQVDRSTLQKVGCAGPFPVFVNADESPDTTAQLIVIVGERLLQFSREGAVADVSPIAGTPATEPAVAPTETQQPTDEPTDTPTETAIPSETDVPSKTPTETTLPTETPTETPAPTDTPVPSETPAPTDTATAPPATAEPTDTTVPTAPAAEPTEMVDLPQTAEEANLPPQLTVQETTYVFASVAVAVDVQSLVQVEVITVEGVEITVYATEQFGEVAPELYCVSANGDFVGRYVVAAAIHPTPPAELPPVFEAQGSTYVFNEVSVDIDVTTLFEVEVVVVQNVELTIYAEQPAQGAPPRVFAVAPDGSVTGQYVESSYVVSLQPAQATAEPTVQFQPPAEVPTLEPNAPSPAAVTAVPTNRCGGSPGPPDAAGIPAYLPNRIQFRGMAYTFVRTEEATAVGELTRIDCVGAFELASAANTDVTQVLFLRIPESTADSQLVFRFEAALTFTVDIEITGQSRDISIGDQPGDRYHLSESWQPALLSSTTVMLFVKDPENATPDVYLAVNVHDTVVGEVIGEYRLPGENSQTSETMSTAATNVGLNPDLTINGQLYVLVNIYYPVGTTPNGFITFFSNQPGGQPDILLARDTRERELFIYRTTATGG